MVIDFLVIFRLDWCPAHCGVNQHEASTVTDFVILLSQIWVVMSMAEYAYVDLYWDGTHRVLF